MWKPVVFDGAYKREEGTAAYCWLRFEMNVAFILIISFFLKVVSASRCENKWSFSPHSENCYLIVDEPIGWNLAEVDCQWKMAHVMSIHSEAENTFVAALALKLGKPIWIGAALFGNSHTYEYADFSNFDYTNWINGTQPEYNKGRKCIKMHPSNGTWFTDCCFKRPVPYLCQKPSGYFETPKATVPENTKPRNTSATSDTMAENLKVISMLKNRFRNASIEKVAAKNTKAIRRTKSVSSDHRQEHSKFIDHTIDYSQKTDARKKGKQTLKKAEQKPVSDVDWQKNMLKATKRYLGTGWQNEIQLGTDEFDAERKKTAEISRS